MKEKLLVGLFAQGTKGTRLLGQTRDSELVAAVRDQIAADRIEELRALEVEGPELPPLQIAPDHGD